MALTKVQKSGITNDAIDADKIEDGTIVAADIAPGTITNAKLAGSIANDKLANSSITVNGSSVSLGGSVSAGKIQWQSVVTADGSTTTSATAGEGYFIDTTSAAHTLTLPGSPSAGDTIAIKDYAANFGTNALTINRNGNNIQGVASDSEISTNRASVVLVYVDATRGWLFTNESNVQSFFEVAYVTATGGTVTTSGDYKIHTFTGDGCFVVSNAGQTYCGVPGGSSVVDYLVIAGGGGGGGSEGDNGSGGGGGGGGAGGYRYSADTYCGPACVTAGSALTVTATTYPITVGGGGSPGNTEPNGSGGGTSGSRGSNSVFSTITSTGGGGGSGCRSSATPNPAAPGGSGGGNSGDATGEAGTGNTPPVSPSQGNNGSPQAPSRRGGSGGGAGGAVTCATGAPGDTNSITGSGVGRAGGGAGGSGSGPRPGNFASDGGGDGGAAHPGGSFTPGNPPTRSSGSANTGGGGGGAGAGYLGDSNGNGGKGIVIIRYKFQN